MNKHKGEYTLILDGESYTVVYDWNAIAKVQSLYGEQSITKLFEGFNPELLAGLLAIGLERHHPELTKERILESSPAYMKCVNAVDKAFAYAYFGNDDVEKAEKKSLVQKILKKTS